MVRAQVQAQAQYKVSFAVDVIASTAVTVLELVTVLVLFRATRSLGEFNVRQALLVAAMGTFAFSLADLAVGNVERLRSYVRTGLLDALLIRPRGVLPQLLATDVAVRRVGSVIQGALVLGFAAGWAHVVWTPARITLIAIAPIAGAAVFAAIFVAGATVAFYWIDSGEFANAFTYGGRSFTAYPITIYSGLFRRLFAYGLGFAFVAYYPSLVLLGRRDPLNAPDWLGWCSPAVAGLAWLVAAVLWRTGIRHYRSTGS